ncbi:DNA-binding protein [Methanolobus sediminis]|uniref:DNA-binding protein n=1 Tax=Methanolobus sediminis TaxID=3072978 RepID=A0AA51ULN9_9EURY|nr:DNA-binding protein [Methanolobus sediminis]WMW25882.1 DNA-binding protein [Methanolobus sediminis]
MVEREVAYRMFAREFNDSRFHLYSSSPSDQDIYSPNFLISPTGVKVNRVLIVGVVTEVDRLSEQKGSERDLWRARISDPTGAFTIYAGSYQSEASVFLSTIQVPSYVMVLGKVRSYEPGDGSVFVSLRPEEMNYVDESIRDRWIVDTAEITLNRLDEFDKFFSGDTGEGKLMDRIRTSGVPDSSAGGMCLSLDYYRNDAEYYDSLRDDVRKALCSIRKSVGTTEDIDYEAEVQSIAEELDDGNGFEYIAFINKAISMNIPEKLADSKLKILLSKGHLYEPRAGIFKVIH